MEYIINCQYQKGFSWHHVNGVSFIGYGYNSNNNYISGIEAIKLFTECRTIEDIKNILSNFNGVFSLIIELENKLFAASDKSRFFPLFYFQEKNALQISDNFYQLVKKHDCISFDNKAVSQFLAGAITLGSLTVIEHIYQIQAGEIVEFNNSAKTSSFIPATYSKETNYNYDNKESISILNKTGVRLSNSLQNKQVVLPLSGGYDSRLIACWLKQNNVNNVVCFTYGRKGTPDIKISENIARELGYEWHYIEHNPAMVANFLNDDEFSDYYKYMSRGTSMFYMQEYFALRELTRKNIIKPNFVAIPGHSGDMLGGSQFYKVIPPNINIPQLPEKVYESTFTYMKLNQKHKLAIKHQLSTELNAIAKALRTTSAYKVFEEWLVRERIAKYVFNSAHVFTYFGGEVRFPFWDDELFTYWFNMPIEKRLYKTYFDKLLNENWFEPFNVKYSLELQASRYDLAKQKIKNIIRPYLPSYYKQKLLKKNDWTLYEKITDQLLPDLKNVNINVKHNNKSYINRILHWYLAQLQKEYSLKSFNE